MNKIFLISLSLFVLLSCSSKEEVEPMVPIRKETVQNIKIKNKTPMMVVPTEFIPEHIRRSTIEVVPH